MRIDGIQLVQGATISNLVVASGTSFPSSPDAGEVFYRSDSATTVRGLYVYIGGTWERIASADSVTVPSGTSFPVSANPGDLFYKNSNDGAEGLYAYNDSTWVAVSASGTSYTITGDVTGTIDGGTDVLTLATVNASTGSFGNNSSYVALTVNGKGLVTSVTTGQINIDAAQVTSGTFSDARIAQSNVTQHQAALALAASQVTSGTLADARIAQSNVTQHQAALTITESQITDGTLLARVGGNETITGSWTFNNPVVSAEPSSSSHLTTKNYVDNALAGLSWKKSVKAATVSNITLSGAQTIDGVSCVAGDRVLVKNQTTQAENGIWVVASGTWTRATDFDATSPIDEVNSAAVFVQQGSTQSDTGWTQTAPVTTVGTDAMVFVQFSASGAYTAGAGLSLSGNAFNVGTASTSRIVVNVDDIDLATVTDAGTGSFLKFTRDAYGRVSGTTAVTTADITALADATYVNVTGDTMTGALTLNYNAAALTVQSANATGAALVLKDSGTTNNLIIGSAGQSMYFQAGGAERMRLDGSGNLGIGATSSGNKLEVIGTIQSRNAAGDTGGLRLWSDVSGNGNIFEYFSAALIFGTNNTEKMRLDSSGNLLVARSSSSGLGVLQVNGSVDISKSSSSVQTIVRAVTAGYEADLSLCGNANATGSSDFLLRQAADGSAYVWNRANLPMYFGTNSIERMCLDTAGRLLVGKTSSPSNFKVDIDHDGSSNNGVFINDTNASAGSPTSLQIVARANDTVTAISLQSAAASRFVVLRNGNVQNANNSYGAISDQRLKQDIVDAGSQWDDVKAVRVRKFHFKNDPTGPLQLGVVAQELQTTSPGLVTEAPDEDKTLSVQYSVLYMKAVKALQEAMERIEALEKRVAALEAK